MSVFRRNEKPTLKRRLADLAMSVGVLALVVGLVCAFVVAGVYGVHASMSRNEDPHATAAAAPPPPPPPSKPAPVVVETAAKPPPVPEKTPGLISPAAAVEPAPPPRAAAKPVDPTRLDEEGFVKYWLVLAPIPSEKELAGGVEIAAARLPDEANLRPRPDQPVKVKGKDLAWRRYRSADFAIDFKKAVDGGRGEDAVAYAVCYLHAPEERRDVKLFYGSNDQGKVWLNGQLVHMHDKPRTLKKDDTVAAGLVLRKGENVVVLKVANEKGNWQGCLRFGDKTGAPMVDLRVTSSPQ
jgi:hypothetical protein